MIKEILEESGTEVFEVLGQKDINVKANKSMTIFTKELTKLSKKTGISIGDRGEVYYNTPNTIKSLIYSDDFSLKNIHCDFKAWWTETDDLDIDITRRRR